jgi:hypothetical protein
MRFVAGRRLHHAEHIGVNEQLSLEFALFPSLAEFCSTFGGKADIGRPFPLRRGNRCCGHCNRAFPRHADECLVGIAAVRRRLIPDAWLVLPEVFEPVRRQGRVWDRGHDRSVGDSLATRPTTGVTDHTKD